MGIFFEGSEGCILMWFFSSRCDSGDIMRAMIPILFGSGPFIEAFYDV